MKVRPPPFEGGAFLKHLVSLMKLFLNALLLGAPARASEWEGPSEVANFAQSASSNRRAK
jgi:hypothetical protein